MGWKFNIFLLFMISLTGCDFNKEPSSFHKAPEIKNIPDNYFTVNATGELCEKFFELRKIVPGQPSEYLYNKPIVLDSAYMFEIKSYDERTDSNYYFIAKFKFRDGINKPAKCMFVRWKNYPNEYKVFSDTTSVLTSLDYDKFMKLYPAFTGRVKTAHFSEIRFSDDFQTSRANYIFTFKQP